MYLSLFNSMLRWPGPLVNPGPSAAEAHLAIERQTFGPSKGAGKEAYTPAQTEASPATKNKLWDI
jgi:hypothetical protein